MMKLNVMSLFDGIACGYEALLKAGILIDKYWASEIDPYAIQVSKNNHPDIIHIGDVTKVNFKDYPSIDLLIGGSPCQNLSICGKRAGLEGEQSSLFYYFVDALRILKPKWFLFENVTKMSEEDKNMISKLLHTQPIMIDSALVSAQHRERYYWTNIPVKQPNNKHIYVKDILAREYESEIDGTHFLNRPVDWIPENKLRKDKDLMPLRIGSLSGLKHSQSNRVYSIEGKSVNLVANSGGSGGKTGLYKIDINEKDYILRKFLPIECERLQTLPDNYTKGISNTQRYKCINNGWTVDVIAHIFKYLKEYN